MSAAEQYDTVIVGAGLTGLSAAYHLGEGCVVLEREDHVGGLAHTHRVRDCCFDITGHWLHLRHEETRRLVDSLLGDDLVWRERRARVYSHGVFTPYPFQANTYGLPREVAAECLLGFLRARFWDRLAHEEPPPLDEPRTFADFILQRLGEGIARHFMFPYNEKLWTVHPRELDASWCERFVPVPSLDDVVLGAFGMSPAALGYNVRFLYPRSGGIARLPQALHASLRVPVRLGDPVVRVDLRARQVHCASGRRYSYRSLVNTAPLDRFLDMCGDLPDEVVRARRLLRHTTITYCNVAARGANPDQPHWVYVPESDIPFFRVGSFTAVEPNNAPPGVRTFYVELAHRPGDEPRGDIEGEAVRALVKMGLVDDESLVLFVERRTIEVAYALPGAEVEPARRTALRYLEDHGVLSTGRYGAWVYAAMEDALRDGMAAASWADARRRGGA